VGYQKKAKKKKKKKYYFYDFHFRKLFVLKEKWILLKRKIKFLRRKFDVPEMENFYIHIYKKVQEVRSSNFGKWKMLYSGGTFFENLVRKKSSTFLRYRC